MRQAFFLEREALVGARKFFLPTLEVAATRLEWYIPRLAHTFSCIEAKSLSRQMNSIHVPFPPCLWHGCSVSLFLFEFYFIILFVLSSYIMSLMKKKGKKKDKEKEEKGKK